MRTNNCFPEGLDISKAGTFFIFNLFVTWTDSLVFNLLLLVLTMTPEVCPYITSLWDLQLGGLPIERHKLIAILNLEGSFALMH